MVDFKAMSKVFHQQQIVVALAIAGTHTRVLIVTKDERDKDHLANELLSNFRTQDVLTKVDRVSYEMHLKSGAILKFHSWEEDIYQATRSSLTDLVWLRHYPDDEYAISHLNLINRHGYNPLMFLGHSMEITNGLREQQRKEVEWPNS
jgi:hypothetical protein